MPGLVLLFPLDCAYGGGASGGGRFVRGRFVGGRFVGGAGGDGGDAVRATLFAGGAMLKVSSAGRYV